MCLAISLVTLVYWLWSGTPGWDGRLFYYCYEERILNS